MLSDPDDPQKTYLWGGRASDAGRTLSARVEEIATGWHSVELTVQATGGEPLEGVVVFHLHSTFPAPSVEVPVVNGTAKHSHRVDREERFCVLTQIQCVGSPSTKEHFRAEGPPALKNWVLRQCARHFDANPARPMLQADKSVRGQFSLEDDTVGIKIDVQLRMKRLGEIREQTMLFNFGALFQQICDTAKIQWREPESEAAPPSPPASA